MSPTRLRTRLNKARVLASSVPVGGYVGWVDQGNLGDEILFAAVKKLFSKVNLIPHQRLTWRIRMIESVLRRGRLFDFVLLGGGTLINEPYQEQIHDSREK